MSNPTAIRHRVDLQPVGRRTEIRPGQTLLDAARQAGVEMNALCGGEGWCHGCVVRVMDGVALSPVTLAERGALTPEQLAAGFRLACQARPRADVKVEIPPESLAAQQRLQVEGQETGVAPDPVVAQLDVTVSPATLHDLRADTVRIREALSHPALRFRLPVLRELSDRLREQDWSVRLGVRGDEVVAVVPPGMPLLGLAVDVGTTKLAAYLVDLASGRTLAAAGAMNPQIAYGEDVISRIAYTLEQEDGGTVLRRRLVESLNTLVSQLCEQAGCSGSQIVEAVIVGNTAMHHLLAGLPVKQLGLAPYVPAVSEVLEFPAREIGLELAPGATVHLPPCIAGYVGSDHVAMALGTGVWESGGNGLQPDRAGAVAAHRDTWVALDIGTNTEVTVVRGGRIWCCSCASGPAFEGAHIRDGMRAAPGAIERVGITDGRVHLKTIENQPPVGICGSGILDAVGEMVRTGLIDRKGAFRPGSEGITLEDGMPQFTLAPASASGHGRPVVITRKDVNEIQLAKAAIRTGVEVLLSEAGAGTDDIEAFIVAGAFGTYLDIESSIRVGMFPPLPLDRFRQVGNAAGTGARQLLVSAARRRTAVEIAPRVQYVELTVHPGFSARYLRALYF
jgi:uncharacterized 2Fe-2S/4Fe-4S cluster protein (DUF4445 family)